jgi:8-oxo-dGTP pyrophosphatase MutT (NUDIX family)
LITNNILTLINESNEIQTDRLRVEVYAFNKDKIKILAHLRKLTIIPKLPAGAVDIGETLIMAAQREMMEESGWIGVNFKHINIPGNWKLEISEEEQIEYFAKWKIKNNSIISETNYCIICEAIKFNPNTTFGSEGDSDSFEMIDSSIIYDLTKNAITKNKRVEFQKNFRLACFKHLGFKL